MAPPSEFDLRAALRDGEGDEPNVDQLIMAGQARRAQRRSRLLSSVVVVAVAGGLGVAAAEFGGSSGTAGSSSAGGALSAPQVGPGGGASAAVGGVACPAAVPTYATADDGNLAPQERSAKLVHGQITSVVVCAYGARFDADAARARTPVRLDLAGRQASRLAHSLDRAPRAAPAATCSNAPGQQYAVIPVNASGSPLPPVTAELSSTGCGATVTNGKTVRYGWHPPPGVAEKLQQLSPTQPPESSVVVAPSTTPTATPTPTPTPSPSG
jgi:hypothetical protein